MNAIKYQGTNKLFTALMEDDNKNDYFIFYASSTPMRIDIEHDHYAVAWEDSKKYINDITGTIKIDIIPCDNILYHLVKLNNKESYDDIVRILENVYEYRN